MDIKKKLQTVKSINYRNSNIHKPLFVFRPKTLSQTTNFFMKNFNGECLYAVKTNPDPNILKDLNKHGINSFDVASLGEIELVHELLPKSKMYFMNPVKSRYSIKEAYYQYNIKNFSLDNEVELDKILQETNNAKDLCLHVRLAIPNNFAELSLSKKFGINLQDAPDLIMKIAKVAKKTGICFHVGSQCMHPDAYKIAIKMAAEIIETSQTKISYFNVGGGFPSIYPGMIPPDLKLYFSTIHKEFAKVKGFEKIKLLAEPGRAIVAESMSLLVRVELRKGDKLYINEGTYGSLFDAGTPKFIFPVKLLCNEETYSTDLMPFSFYGPTCDSLDYMPGPFYLPCDTKEGDIIEIGQMGAYARSMTTGFNGFMPEKNMLYVSDPPLMTLYNETTTTLENYEYD